MKQKMYVEFASVGERGQITIPKDIRELLMIKPKDKIAFEIRGKIVMIMKVPKSPAKAFVKLFEDEFEDIDSVEFQKRIRMESEKDIEKEISELYAAGS